MICAANFTQTSPSDAHQYGGKSRYYKTGAIQVLTAFKEIYAAELPRLFFIVDFFRHKEKLKKAEKRRNQAIPRPIFLPNIDFRFRHIKFFHF